MCAGGNWSLLRTTLLVCNSPRFRFLVRSVQQNVRGIVMQLGQRDRKLLGHVQSDRGENRMPLAEEGIQRLAQPVVVELLGRNVPQDVSPAFGGPTRNIHQRHRTIQPRCDQQAQHGAMLVLRTRVGRQMSIDNARHIHPFKQRPHHGQRAKATTIRRRLVSIPCKSHPNKMHSLEQ